MLVCAVHPPVSKPRSSREKKEEGKPENFLIPNRFPGEPPWFLTVPPARFVAVLADPRPLFLAESLQQGKYQSLYHWRKKDRWLLLTAALAKD
jgi:hypothetical protein